MFNSIIRLGAAINRLTDAVMASQLTGAKLRAIDDRIALLGNQVEILRAELESHKALKRHSRGKGKDEAIADFEKAHGLDRSSNAVPVRQAAVTSAGYAHDNSIVASFETDSIGE